MRFLRKLETPLMGTLTRKQKKLQKQLSRLDKISKKSSGFRTILRKSQNENACTSHQQVYEVDNHTSATKAPVQESQELAARAKPKSTE